MTQKNETFHSMDEIRERYFPMSIRQEKENQMLNSENANERADALVSLVFDEVGGKMKNLKE